MHQQLINNLSNLHQFWLALGGAQQGNLFTHQIWPNHYWQADFKLPDINKVPQGKVMATIENPEAILLQAEKGFQQLVVLTAMNLMINPNMHDFKLNSKVVELTSNHDFSGWVKTCSRAFGYQIDLAAIEHLSLQPKVSILAYLSEGRVAGTVICYQTGQVLGVHQLGVAPDFRGQKIARSLMQHVLAMANKLECEQVCLQASEAALNLYLSLGFIPVAKLSKVCLSSDLA